MYGGDVLNIQSLLSQALTQASRGAGTQVIVAPTGTGKTTQLIQLLPGRLDAFPRVLWAVLQTGANRRDEAVAVSPPLAEEVRLAFLQQIPAPQVEILYGRSRFQDERSYQGQFSWEGEGQQVRIISHAHLPWLFRPSTRSSRPHQFADRASLLVIDEDPTGALLRSSTDASLSRQIPFRRWAELLAQVGVLDATSADYPAFLSAAETFEGFEGVRDFGRPKQPSGRGLTGQPFWSRLLPFLNSESQAWTGTLQERMAAALAVSKTIPARRQAASLSELFVDAFTQDLAAARRPVPQTKYSTRIGAHRLPGAQAHLRFNLRQPLALACPVLLLDAYANEDQYTALFAERPPTFLRADAPHQRPLHIELAPSLTVHRLDLIKKNVRAQRTGEATLPERYELIAQELQDLRSDQLRRWRQRQARQVTGNDGVDPPGLLLLTSRDFEQDSYWKGLLERAFVQDDRSFEQEGEHLYWYVGRGKNAWSGNDVVALNIPKLPSTYAWYEMAALYPFDRARREALKTHLEQSELLQMLGRGRQTRFARSRPRVVVAATNEDVAWMLARSDLSFAPFETKRHFQSHAKSALAQAQLHGVVRELLDVYGAVPVLALTALRLISMHRTVRPPTPLEQELFTYLQKDGKAPSKRPNLHQMLGQPPEVPLFKQVALPRLDRMLAQTLVERGLERREVLGQQVYAPMAQDELDTALVLRRIFGSANLAALRH